MQGSDDARPELPRRQQFRRLRRAAARCVAGLVACIFAVIAASAGVWAVAGALLLVAVGLLFDARHWVRLAARSRIGARSEDEVRHALAALEAGGVAGASLAPVRWARGYR